jgi:hypothetical protein
MILKNFEILMKNFVLLLQIDFFMKSQVNEDEE